MSEKAHVLVVGGGPAGTTTAILCRCYGLRVALIEASPFPRMAPGESLPPGMESYFDTLGVRDKIFDRPLLTYKGNRVRWDGDGESFLFGKDDSGVRQEGLLIPRDHLDSVLLERAREVGVEILQPCAARGVYGRKGRLCGVVTDRGNFATQFVVDAAGSRHWLARKLKLPLRLHSPPLFGHYGWAEGTCPPRLEEPLIEADPGGWTWTSRVDEHLYQYTRLSFARESLAAHWLPPEYAAAGMRPLYRPRGADLTWREVSVPSGPGFFLAGDALVRTDPLVQLGGFKAIRSGFKIATLLDQILGSGLDEEEAHERYARWVEESYMADLPVLRSYYRRHPNAPSNIQDLESRVQVEWPSADWRARTPA